MPDTHDRRPAVHSVDEFVFSVPALDEARQFFTSFGLEVRAHGDTAIALHTFGHPHRWGRVIAGATKRLAWLSLGIHAPDLPRFEEHLRALGVPRVPAPPGADPGGLWLADPEGLPIQLRVAEKCSPSQPSPREFPPPGRNAGRSPSRSQTHPIRPLYLSHILLFAADVERTSRFYFDVLGLQLSDRSGDLIVFMHSPHGSDHHLIAVAKGGGIGLHHTSWCVPSIDEVGIGMEQMVKAGHPHGWGVGRHVLGSNYFRYVRDPWGSYAEYSFDIDFVAPGARWPAGDHPAEDALYVWGPTLPADFVTNYELPAGP